jgi:hypothetical protein
LLFLVGAWVDPSINPGLYQLPKEQKAAIRVLELQAVNDRFQGMVITSRANREGPQTTLS